MVLVLKDDTASVVMPPDLGVMGRVSGQREKTHIKAEENSVRYKTLMKRQFGAILGWRPGKTLLQGCILSVI